MLVDERGNKKELDSRGTCHKILQKIKNVATQENSQLLVIQHYKVHMLIISL